MAPRLDHVMLDVSDYAASKAFYERALAPLGMKVVMEPNPEVGGFGADFPFFWIASRGRGPDSGVHVAFTAQGPRDGRRLPRGGAGGRRPRQRRARRARDLPPELLRRLRARS